MSHKNCFSFLLLALMMLSVARAVHACSCGPTPTVLDAYEDADVVVIARAVSFDKSDAGKVALTHMTVEKVYKGNLKPADEIIFLQGGGASCIWSFEDSSLDRQYLFYLKRFDKESKVWMAAGCGRSTLLENADDDLLYLNKRERVRGKTRISGTLRFEQETTLSLAGRRVRITGGNKSYEVKTDGDGVYEIYDLPPGKYTVEPEVPLGWKVNGFYLEYSPSFIGNRKEEAPTKILIKLEAKRHASLDIHFEVDDAIRGRILDPAGKPMKDVCIAALPAPGEKENGFHFDCTDENGNFSIKELPRASYILSVNNNGKISSDEPFKTFYYPGVSERARAAVLTIGEGEIIEGITVNVPAVEETITVEGLLLYEDGKPVVEELVQFKAAEAVEGTEGDAHTRTDAQGRFSLKILKGRKGTLYGAMYAYIGKFKKCPKLESIIKKDGRSSLEITTPALKVEGENNLYNVELKFPFPGCEKAKEEEEEDEP